MEGSLLRLLYTSRSRLSESGTALAGALDAIVCQAAANNVERGLTGVLLHVRGMFIQALEGPAAAIEGTFEAICCDARHGELRLVEMMPTETRLFADWSMAFVGLDDDPAKVGINRDLKAISVVIENDPQRALAQMRDLLGSARGKGSD